MKPRRPVASFLAVFTAACAFVLWPSTGASAHPLGNFTVNRYDGLVAAPGLLRVDHVEDLAEIPATQAGPAVTRLGLTEWARQRCADAAEGSRLTVDGRRTALTVTSSAAHRRPGQAGLDTLRVECGFTAPLPERDGVSLRFQGAGVSSGPGWREITARGDRTTLVSSDVPEKSVSHELTSYPAGLLSSPADIADAALRVRPGGPALAGQRREAPGAAVLPRGSDRWTRALDGLVARHDLTPGFAALALVVAVGLGAMHALAPGHGKTLMAATAAARGGRARPRDVLPLAASVTVTHTLGVVTLGLLVTAGSAATPSVIAWLGVASGALVLGAGVSLVRRAWKNRAAQAHRTHGHVPAPVREPALAGVASATGRDHPHHEHAPAPTHDSGHRHDHAHPHDHDHEDGHGHGVAHPHDHEDGHRHGHGVVHSHGGVPHTHPAAPTLRGTILLGFAGGLVPSPSAVVVLVGAAALGQAWFGLLLVVAYGAGLALTLTAAGFAVVRLGAELTRAMGRRPRWSLHPVTALVRRSVPLASACLVVALGAGLVLKGAASALG